GREREQVAADARLVGGARRVSGYRVTATVAGVKPGARLLVSYFISGARWYPGYDIQLVPDKGQVLVNFAGLVSQETGEDWEAVQLTLSTAVPSQATEFPRLATWKIGEKDRFV